MRNRWRHRRAQHRPDSRRRPTPFGIPGLRSAGVAVLDDASAIGLSRTVGKVAQLEEKLDAAPLSGRLGVAHTRWATHGGVTEANAHPHLSGDRVAVIHNGIIEISSPSKTN